MSSLTPKYSNLFWTGFPYLFKAGRDYPDYPMQLARAATQAPNNSDHGTRRIYY